MIKPTYLQGIHLAEEMYKQHGYTIPQLYQYLNDESSITQDDYRWSDHWNGFHDYICYVQGLLVEGIDVKDCIVKEEML